MSTVQMNLRLDSQLKEKGDNAITGAGYSVSGAVRTIWSFAAAHVHEPQVVREYLQQAGEGLSPRSAERMELLQSSLARCAELREKIDALAGHSNVSDMSESSRDNAKISADQLVEMATADARLDKELLGDARLSRWEERGLI